MRYNIRPGVTPGEYESEVAGWTVTYPAACNGRVGDLGFLSSTGQGGSGFVHFDQQGEPYGMPMTIKARARLLAMRRDLKDA